jgi:hypothetical protein
MKTGGRERTDPHGCMHANAPTLTGACECAAVRGCCAQCACTCMPRLASPPGPMTRRTTLAHCRRHSRRPCKPCVAPQYPCDKCGRQFDNIASLGGHGRFCDGGAPLAAARRCNTPPASPTPHTSTRRACAGAGAVCFSARTSHGRPDPVSRPLWSHPVHGRHGRHGRHGHGHPRRPHHAAHVRHHAHHAAYGRHHAHPCTRPPPRTPRAHGRHSRPSHTRRSSSRARRAGNWRCGWCDCKRDECSGKGPGPQGSKTLCSGCSARWRSVPDLDRTPPSLVPPICVLTISVVADHGPGRGTRGRPNGTPTGATHASGAIRPSTRSERWVSILVIAMAVRAEEPLAQTPPRRR